MITSAELDQAIRALSELREDIDHFTAQPLTADDRLAAAMSLASVANEILQNEVDHYRSKGKTWQDVGNMFDISRQAAQQRFS